MTTLIEPSDLAPFATIDQDKAAAMIADATALALERAPCLASPDAAPVKLAAAKAILRGAILRYAEAGSGAVERKTIGPFGQTVDTRQKRTAMFEPSELADLSRLCSSGLVSLGVATGRTGRYRTGAR